MKPEILIGNTRSKVYHRPQCYCTKMIDSKHMETFPDEAPSNYRPCSKCYPETPNFNSLEEVINYANR